MMEKDFLLSTKLMVKEYFESLKPTKKIS